MEPDVEVVTKWGDIRRRMGAWEKVSACASVLVEGV